MFKLLAVSDWNPFTLYLSHIHTTHAVLASWIVHLVINSVQLNYLEAGDGSLSTGSVSCLLADFLLLIRLGKSEVDLHHLLIIL